MKVNETCCKYVILGCLLFSVAKIAQKVTKNNQKERKGKEKKVKRKQNGKFNIIFFCAQIEQKIDHLEHNRRNAVIIRHLRVNA